MKYKVIDLAVRKTDGVAPEIMYNVASERVDSVELICFNLPVTDDETVRRRINSAALRTFKEMKSRGAIQLYATRSSFLEQTTEAKYLINKFPELFEDADYEAMDTRSIYVKL